MRKEEVAWVVLCAVASTGSVLRSVKTLGVGVLKEEDNSYSTQHDTSIG
jgi:hypothetical protein